MKRVRIISSIISIILAFIIFQSTQIFKHHENKKEINVADIYSFLQHFDLLFLSRTLKHEKGIFYWFDWIDNEAGLVTMNKTMSLLHFDVHGIEDNSDEPIHVCTAPNLFVYDFFVKQTLDIAYTAYFNDFNPKQNGNVTRHAFRKGYVRDILWIYPNHWINYSKKLVMNTSFALFQQLIYHQTYYINPKQRKLLYLQNNLTKENEIWTKLFDTNNIFKSVQNKLDSFDNLEINIWTLSLNQYLNEPYFKRMNINNMILDIDLDFFLCQEPAQTFMNYFDWNPKLVINFNNILSHHQYIPSHMFSEYSNHALITLLYLLNENKTETLKLIKLHENEPIPNTKFKMPQIEDVFKIGIEEKMDIPIMKRVMHLLYEYQMQRSLYHNKSVQHLMHFDNIFKILNIAHRRLIDIEIIGYRDSEEALRGIKVSGSNHMDHLFKIAEKEAKNEYFLHQKMETTKIRDIVENKDDTFKQFEEFATKLIELDKHRNLLSAEIDEMAKQNEINTSNHEQRMPQIEWNDEQLKDLMNMTTDYLYHDWKTILFNESNNKQTESWKYKYPQWVSKQKDDTDDILNFIPNQRFSPYNQDKDHSKMHTNTNDNQNKQAQFVLHFDDLDPLQQHFLQRANHAKLKSFVDELNPKQHIFLKWLIFCYYHQVKCRGRKYLPNTFNKSRHFGYDFVWHEINGWPQLIENDEKSEILQLEIGRYHSQFRTFIHAEEDEIIFIPSSKDMQTTLNEFEQLLSAKNSKIITVGIELSPGHIPKKHRHIIECKLYKLIENTMFFNKQPQTKPCFVRLKKMENDHIVPYLPC